MTDYRAILEDFNKKDLMKKFPQHVDDYGGLFVSETRQNILGINPKNPNPFVDTSKMWSKIKKSVRNGFVDIQLISKISSPKQAKKMFEHIPDYPQQETGGYVPEEFVNIISPNLVSAISSILNSAESDDPKHQNWKYDLSIRIIKECLEYFFSKHLIHSPVHERHLREVIPILGAELNRY